MTVKTGTIEYLFHLLPATHQTIKIMITNKNTAYLFFLCRNRYQLNYAHAV